MVIEGVFRPDEADRVAEAAVRIAQRDQVGLRDKQFVDISEDGNIVTPGKLKDLFIKDPVFREFFVDPRLSAIVRALVGEEPLLLGDQTFMKTPRAMGPKSRIIKTISISGVTRRITLLRRG